MTVVALIDDIHVRVDWGETIIPIASIDCPGVEPEPAEPTEFELALRELYRGTKPHHRQAALRELVLAGEDGLTDFELEKRTQIKQTSIGKRRWDIQNRGMVVDTNRKRPSDTNSPSTVRCVTRLGRRVWAEFLLREKERQAS
ncbi:MAG: hypothetical protein AAGA42_02420 [Actinomycetota bacterium]